ncbi:phage tail tip fiber protein [Rahnella aceris]
MTQSTEAYFDSSAIADIENSLANDRNAQSQRAATGKSLARITTTEKAQADANGAFAEFQQTVQVQFDDTSAAVQQTASAVATLDGKLSAQWGVKVQTEVNGVVRIAGIQLGIDGAGGASNFLISADTFAVYNPTSGGQELVFASMNGQMFIRSAFIQNASIGRGKITDTLQSDNYIQGQSGLLINFKTGQIENYGTGSGGKMKTTNTTISVADGNGVLRVQIGELTGVF